MTDTTEYTAQLAKLTRQLRKGATNLSRRDLRYLVNVYEEVQKHRIRAGQQVKAAEREGNEPNFVIVWMRQTFSEFEESVKKILDVYTSADPVGRWIRSIPGLGPYIAAGLLALIEIEKAPTVGHIWRFAGLDPTMKWSPGQKRPFNARLKRICYFIGQAFVLYKKKGVCTAGFTKSVNASKPRKTNAAITKNKLRLD
jgi:Transposase IS116/IS110/IS902 family.